MRFLKNIFYLIFLYFFLAACNNELPKTNYNYRQDSIAINKVVKDMYNWYDSLNKSLAWSDFPLLYQDSIYIAIDSVFLKDNIYKLKKLPYFSIDFITQYYRAHMIGDSILRHPKYKYLIDEIPPLRLNNPWCNCQDGGSFTDIKVHDLKLQDNIATLHWTWNDTTYIDTSLYIVKLIKVDTIWKISYLEGFDVNTMPFAIY